MLPRLTRSRKLLSVVVAIAGVLCYGFTITSSFPYPFALMAALILLPVLLVTYTFGGRVGMIFAVAAFLYDSAVFMVNQLAFRHVPFTVQFFFSLAVGAVITLLLPTLLGRVLDMNVRLRRMIRDKESSDTALKNTVAHFEAVLKALPDLLIELDRHGTYYAISGNSPEMLYMPKEKQIGRTVSDVLPREAADTLLRALAEAAAAGRHVGSIYSLPLAGGIAWYEASVAAIGDPSNPDCHFVLLARDVSDRIALEKQLLQSQKMEAVGILAGGIAHDFNNIIQTILGFCELIAQDPADTGAVTEDVSVIQESAGRAASLTNQLLAFSRKKVFRTTTLDAGKLVAGMESLLARSLGEDVSLSISTGDGPLAIQGDETQVQQVIMNLAVNARDAMPNGGGLSISVDSLDVAGRLEGFPEIVPGAYVRIAVSDTGSGIDNEVLPRIFEPFFTTKEQGKGTGLGLSIVYGIVKECHGHIRVRSEVGHGTAFDILFPAATGGSPGKVPPRLAGEEARGTETILIVEDQEPVRQLLKRVLEKNGYKAVVSSNGAEALALLRSGMPIDLLLTDVIMPGGINGFKVSEAFRKLRPSIAVVVMSGYADKLDGGGGKDLSMFTLAKPFTMADLARTVRHALDSAASRPAGTGAPAG